MLNIPNSISFVRLLLIPVFIWLSITDSLALACITIFVASFTDWLDGYAARKLNQFTRLGQLLDPVSDRLYILSLLFVLYYLELAPVIILVLILFRLIMLFFSN